MVRRNCFLHYSLNHEYCVSPQYRKRKYFSRSLLKSTLSIFEISQFSRKCAFVSVHLLFFSSCFPKTNVYFTIFYFIQLFSHISNVSFWHGTFEPSRSSFDVSSRGNWSEPLSLLRIHVTFKRLNPSLRCGDFFLLTTTAYTISHISGVMTVAAVTTVRPRIAT